jgi:hypothetical protein
MSKTDRPWRGSGWWTSPFNFLPEVRASMELPARVAFHDVTLRDGEQTPGVVFRKDDKKHIATLLDEAGVDRIEVAMPAVSQEDAQAVAEVARLGLRAHIYAFCRATAADIDVAADCDTSSPTGRPTRSRPRASPPSDMRAGAGSASCSSSWTSVAPTSTSSISSSRGSPKTHRRTPWRSSTRRGVFCRKRRNGSSDTCDGCPGCPSRSTPTPTSASAWPTRSPRWLPEPVWCTQASWV